MKRIVIIFTLLSIVFANSAKINVVNNFEGLSFEISVDNKTVLKISEYKKVSETIEVPTNSQIAIHHENRLMYESRLRFKHGSTSTFIIDKTKNDDSQSLISFTRDLVENEKRRTNQDTEPQNVDSIIDENKYEQNKRTRGMLEVNQVANVQIIHNSPYPVVDIYVDNVEALSDVPYRASTGLLQIPTSTIVSIAPANGDIIADFPFTLETDGNYVVTAAGILGNSSAPFGLIASGLEVMAVDSNHFGLKVFHGVTDAPAVDIYANGGLLVENLSYSEYAGYLQVPVGDYTIDVTAHGSEEPVASFAAPLSGFGGGTGIVFASGFLASVSDSAFSLILTTPSGYSVQLPSATTALSTIDEMNINPSAFSLNQNYPNPFNPSTTISFDVYEASRVSLSVFDLNGRLVKNLMSGNLGSGTYHIDWNGKNTKGLSVAGGVYFYSITSDENSIIKKMSLIK